MPEPQQIVESSVRGNSASRAGKLLNFTGETPMMKVSAKIDAKHRSWHDPAYSSPLPCCFPRLAKALCQVPLPIPVRMVAASFARWQA